MAFLHKLSCVLAIAAVTLSATSIAKAQQEDNITPKAPLVIAKFNPETENVEVTLTASDYDDSWQHLPDGTTMKIILQRTCEDLNEYNVPMAEWDNIAPNQEVKFINSMDDTDGKGWTYGHYLEYKGLAQIGDNVCSYPQTIRILPGYDIYFEYNSTKAVARDTGNGTFAVDVSVPLPTTYYNEEYEMVDLPASLVYSAIKLYQTEGYYGDPANDVLVATLDNQSFTPGETYTLTDNTPILNTKNYYKIVVEHNYGFGTANADVFVGNDVPDKPGNLNAQLIDGVVKITWEAPTKGKNGGAFNPAETKYNVYREDVNGNNKKMIAESISELEYTDDFSDLTEIIQAVYKVTGVNSVGEGDAASYGSGYNDTKIVIGPNYTLPFTEDFLNYASEKIWNTAVEPDSYSIYWNFATSAYDSNYNAYYPHSGEGLAYVDYGWSYGDTYKCKLTSKEIDVNGAANPVVSFWYYAMPSSVIKMALNLSKDGGEYQTLKEFAVGDDCTMPEWRQVVMPIDVSDANYFNIQLYADNATDPNAGGIAIIDDVAIIDYPSVGAISVEYNSEDCTATLTWDDPSTEYAVVQSYEAVVDGESAGTVTSPWVYQAADYKTPAVITIKAVYEGYTAPESAPVTVSVPRPAYTEFTIDNHTYSIVQDAANNTKQVIIKEYLGSEALYKTPELVKYDDISWEVIAIGEGAYRENSSLVSVNMAPSITEVGAEAFKGCGSLAAVEFGTAVTKVGDRAFADCSALASVVFCTEDVPEIGTDAFAGIAEGCKGKCPDGTEEAYATTQGLEGIDFGWTSVNGIAIDSLDGCEIFNLYGERIAQPERGTIVIVRKTQENGEVKTYKQVVK